MRVLLCALVTCISVCIFPAEARKGSITDRCSNQPEPGDCASRQKWYYDTSLTKCEPFMFGDCPANMEFFSSFEECTDTCKGSAKEPGTTGKYKGHKKDKRQRMCSARPEEGDCDYVKRWYYDPRRDKCRRFRDGDCEGDHTFFTTKSECMDTCQDVSRKPQDTGYVGEHGGKEKAPPSTTTTSPPKMERTKTRKEGGGQNKDKRLQMCSASPEGGDCDYVKRWYYDPRRDKCSKFREGDCEGDHTFFETKSECLDACQGTSNKPEDTGHVSELGGKEKVPPSTTTTRPPQTETPTKTDKHGRQSKGKRPPRRGTCFTRPRKGRCDDNSEKWWYNGGFWTCVRVKKGYCPNHGKFFNSCEECMQKCRRTMARNCMHRT
ncbi:tissue factor pathway inhibitor-like isoform X3 [Dermacentor variabilis]|uniref:tissue factor pathway inhibitor-like isoform X3 n=1 Tax=Dermacentor variabilis TaxID=34621 RepID=UPI003F5AF884